MPENCPEVQTRGNCFVLPAPDDPGPPRVANSGLAKGLLLLFHSVSEMKSHQVLAPVPLVFHSSCPWAEVVSGHWPGLLDSKSFGISIGSRPEAARRRPRVRFRHGGLPSPPNIGLAQGGSARLVDVCGRALRAPQRPNPDLSRRVPPYCSITDPAGFVPARTYRFSLTTRGAVFC